MEEVHDDAFSRAIRIFDGEDPDFPRDSVSAALDSVGWSGASLAFKEQVLNHAGRQEVMDAVDGGGPRPRGRVLRRFLRVLNIALDSLGVIPGVEAVRELKDFAENASSE